MEQPDNVTIAEMEKLCEQAFMQRALCEGLEENLDKEKGILKAIQLKMENYLTHFQMKRWGSALGDIEIRERKSVKTPKTQEEKEALFKWLTDKGIYWQLVNINSQSLNSLYNEEFEIANQEGRLSEFSLPGIGEPEIYRTSVLKPKR